MPADRKRIVTKCNLRYNKYQLKWKQNWLKLHYESAQNLTLERVKMEAKNFFTPDKWTILGSLLIGSSGVYGGSHAIDDLSPQDTTETLASHIAGIEITSAVDALTPFLFSTNCLHV